MEPGLGYLKNIGHKLLDEYVSLDSYKGSAAERRAAYIKLASKLNLKEEVHKAHFSYMHTSKEILNAIRQLEKMIEKRKQRIEFEGRNKAFFAPNLMELQQKANELNKHLHQ